MKDLSFLFLKNFMGSKMRRGFRNVCNDDNSTSTLNQKQPTSEAPSQQPSSSYYMENDIISTLNAAPPRKSVTLEEMILQLELEEEMARKEKAAINKHTEEMNFHRRMSCVNNSDILRSARNALNQYPRFSLDGRDAMYRSSFRKHNLTPSAFDGLKLGRLLHLPHSVGGENVIWCKPGVVPKLMGLEAMPLPISRLYSSKNNCNKESKQKLCNAIRTQNLKRREKNEFDRRQQMRHAMDSNGCCGRGVGGVGGGRHSTSSVGYGVMNPLAVEHVICGLGGPISDLRS